MRTALDTNILSALFSSEPGSEALAGQVYQLSISGVLVICGAVYSEILAHPTVSVVRVDEFLVETQIRVDHSSDTEMWFAAGLAYRSYAERRRRSQGGEPKRLLIDFIVGAHASLHADRLLTLDRSRYSRAFPKLRLQ